MSSDRLVSFTAALYSKYLDDGGDGEDCIISFPTCAGGSRNLVYERCDKMKRDLRALVKRKEIDLKCSRIGYIVHEDEEVFNQLRNVQVLDLSFNHFSSWIEIANVVYKMPALKHIIVTGNPLKALTASEYQEIAEPFSQLKVITVGKLDYDWSQITVCCENLWPMVEDLDLFANLITSIETPLPESMNRLTTITLNDNKIAHWRYINILGSLQRLTSLRLVNCHLDSIEIDGTQSLFPRLKHLNLKSNLISSWRDIANLNRLPSLEELIIRDNPLFEDMNFDYVFNFVLSIVGNLKFLNRQQITTFNRKDGEIHYLRFYYPKYLRSIDREDKNFLQENPRYLEILEEYGAPLDLVPRNKKKPPSKLIELTLQNSITGCSITKKIPRTLTVAALKVLIRKFLVIDQMTDIFLWVKSTNDLNQEIEYQLDKDEHSLEFYSIKSHDQILVKFS